MASNFELKELLEIIFKVTKKNSKILAHQYLLKDVSIISKWRNNVVLPRDYDIGRIVDFVNEQSTSSQKLLIRNNIEDLLRKSSVKPDLKDIILGTEDFCDFLKEALSISVSAHDRNNDVYCEEKSDIVKSFLRGNTDSKNIENKNTDYSGKLELDFVLPEGSSLNLKDLSKDTEIEFNGKLNFSPKKKVLRVANLYKSKPFVGLSTIFVILFASMVFSETTSYKDPENYNAKNSEIYSNVLTAAQSAEVPVVTEQPSFSPSVPSPTPEPSIAPTNTPAAQKREKKEASKNINNNSNNTNTTTNSTTIIHNNTNINISGQNQTTIIGNENNISYGFE